jgi:uncharacterized phage protein (TIGR02218 family)
MRPATSTLQNLINAWSPNSNIRYADLYTFNLIGGESLRYSGFQVGVNSPAPNTDLPLIFFPLGPSFSRTKAKFQVGTKVNELDVDIFATGEDSIGLGGSSITWQSALRNGLFDGATCDIWRAYLTPPDTRFPSIYPTAVGSIQWFYGRVGDFDLGRSRITMRIKSLMDLLTISMPRRLLQASCTWVFGQDGCFFKRSTMAAYITCQAGSNTGLIYTTLVPTPLTLYDNGTIIGLTGANTGYSRTITKLTGGSFSAIYYFQPWVFPVVAGTDTFELLPGCDHTLDTCTNVFNNSQHYGGFPYVPPPETAI